VSPTTGAVSPTSAANVTTDPGQLPPTGASGSTALVAVSVLGLGALVFFVTRKFRAIDE
jgi:LPXTG-motif cell wall-anchored protein